MIKKIKYLILSLLTCLILSVPINLYADVYSRNNNIFLLKLQNIEMNSSFLVNNILNRAGYIGLISSYLTIGGGISANEWYQTNVIGEYYDNNENGCSSARRASRPGGGTGVIPNPTPIGEVPYILILGFCAVYIIEVKINKIKNNETHNQI